MLILLVEDEQGLREGLVDLLVGDGHRVEAVADGEAATDRGIAEPFDLIVLDIMLPKRSGTEVCKRVRAARPGVPILMLTARASEDDKVRSLSDGADDYMTKPFSARELLARVRALGRRASATDAEILHADDARFDLGRLVVEREGELIPITPREAGILRLLHRSGGNVVSRGALLEGVFGMRADVPTRAVDMAIAVLRKKVERAPARPRIILSVKGAGYAWGGNR